MRKKELSQKMQDKLKTFETYCSEYLMDLVDETIEDYENEEEVKSRIENLLEGIHEDVDRAYHILVAKEMK